MFETTLIETSFGTCALKRTERKTLGISVHPDGAIELAAPQECTVEDILKRMIKRRRWINRQRHQFAQINAAKSPPRYCSGATHRYLGRQYRLSISKGEAESVKLKGGYFKIKTADKSESNVQKLLDQWVRERAVFQFTKRIHPWKSWCQNKQLPEPRLRIRKMAKRWGSAHLNGTILLNPDLVKAPSVCIDYVITHEICHLKHPQHDRAFHNLLAEMCPNWQSLKLRLEQSEL
jgi:predicted metal-dependent hydrolase